jgi:ABC-type Zn uptake system ZnuABC Zn-binding protein ZnuA
MTRRSLGALLAAALLGSALTTAGEAAARLRVVATIPDLAALTEAVGGDRVTVDVLARAGQNPHDLEIRPSLMVKLRRADALVVNGLDLDQWADAVIRGASNAGVVPGAPGHIDASRGVPVLDVPAGRVDRSMGDVHPRGNPHYTLDPGLAAVVTQNILEGLARVAPTERPVFERQRQAFLERLDAAMPGWQARLAPVRDARIVVYHNNFVYFLRRFGLTQVGTIEDRPGIPPSPAHLARLIGTLRDGRRPLLVVAEPWNDQRLAARLAEEAGGRLVVLNPKPGASRGGDAYLAAVEANVEALARAMRRDPS